ncbi:MAG: SO_0444 family Cu/Zn efflux transporter [Desulfovibrionaceae bacterium]|nr:SO_0444 family Cu/Zn efflux transporter [Desulfovibrionaceae bacterium]
MSHAVIEAVSAMAAASLDVFVESAPYMLFGMFVAGLLRAFVPEGFIFSKLGGRGPGSVLWASLLGAPLPLCSCGVIPAAAEIRRRGAGKGATTAFLISTPETGVDSVAVTYALLGPAMAVIRPLAAVVTATLAGLFVNALDRDRPTAATLQAPRSGSALHAPVDFAAGLSTPDTDPDACTGNCGCGNGPSQKAPLLVRLMAGIRYAFGNLLPDIGGWFVLGVVLSGIISALVPPDFIQARLGSGLLPMLAVLAVAVPLYVCATASTPIAAALLVKGLSPGAALVFLLAGPATNAATLAVAVKILGKRGTACYLAAIVACSLAAGLALDAFFPGVAAKTAAFLATSGEDAPGLPSYLAAVALAACLLWPLFAKRRTACECGCTSPDTPRP